MVRIRFIDLCIFCSICFVVSPRFVAAAETVAQKVAEQVCIGQELEDSDYTQETRRVISENLGAPAGEICEDSDLIRDFYADPMAVFDIIATLCDKFGLELPQNENLVTLSAIVAYLETAQKVSVSELSSDIRLRGDEATEENILVQKVFYASDRKRTGSSEPNEFYGGERTLTGKLEYGIYEVTIPLDVHVQGRMERPAWYNLEFSEDPSKHIVLKRIVPLNAKDFFREIDNDLQDATQNSFKEAFVFIHGYNVSFTYAARRTAQMTYDLKFPGIPILYSWPSDAKLASYMSDREDVEWSVPHIQELVDGLLQDSKIERLHLVAHSMGNQGLIRTLYAIALRRGDDKSPLFDNIILAAPDFDAQAFTEQFAPHIVSLAKRWTIYASENDSALDASSALATKRLGQPIAITYGMDIVDATGIDVAPWSVPEFHSYYASKQRVVEDFTRVFKGYPPAARNLLERTIDGFNYWRLKPLDTN